MITEPAAGTTPDSEPLAAGESDAYKLDLPAFHGPLDLLLHLIKQQKIDIYDIPILQITKQYNSYLDAMQELDLEVAADFIYMAALLIHIKSKMLLPRDPELEDHEDPRAELVTRLLEYQRFKSVAESLSELDVVRMGVWSRPKPPRLETEAAEIDMSEVSLFDLIDAFRSAINRYRHDHPHAIELVRMVHKISDKMTEIVKELSTRSPLRLMWLLEGRGREELIAIFLGMLELVRLGAISLNQDRQFAEVVIRRTGNEIDPASFARYDS
ncbi:MAG TPA: segregation/condensation protein A [Thermoanaerobaculia bacterium]|nr:segregation/condensation protein A [Thermoanaerobaculia bacterium]